MRHAHKLRQRLRRVLARLCARLGLTRAGPTRGRHREHEADEWLGIG